MKGDGRTDGRTDLLESGSQKKGTAPDRNWSVSTGCPHGGFAVFEKTTTTNTGRDAKRCKFLTTVRRSRSAAAQSCRPGSEAPSEEAMGQCLKRRANSCHRFLQFLAWVFPQRRAPHSASLPCIPAAARGPLGPHSSRRLGLVAVSMPCHATPFLPGTAQYLLVGTDYAVGLVSSSQHSLITYS